MSDTLYVLNKWWLLLIDVDLICIHIVFPPKELFKTYGLE